MTGIVLLIDPDLLLPSSRERAPHALIRRFEVVKTVFGYFQADPHTGPRCGRCNRLKHVHLWQLIDDGEAEDGGVIVCNSRAER